MESKWSGSIADGFFNAEQFDRCRVISYPEDEYEASGKKTINQAHYILSADVGRKGWIRSFKTSLIAGTSAAMGRQSAAKNWTTSYNS